MWASTSKEPLSVNPIVITLVHWYASIFCWYLNIASFLMPSSLCPPPRSSMPDLLTYGVWLGRDAHLMPLCCDFFSSSSGIIYEQPHRKTEIVVSHGAWFATVDHPWTMAAISELSNLRRRN